MPIKVTCHNCSATLTGRDELAGKKVKCPKCKALLTVPAAPGGTFELQPAPPASTSGTAQGPPVVAAPMAADIPEVETGGPEPDLAGEGLLGAEPTPAPGVNIPATLSLPLAFLAWPAVAILFFLVFKQLLHSLVGGAVVALLAIGCGVAGLVIAMKKGKRTGAMLLSIFGTSIAGVSLISMAVSFIFAMMAAKAAEEIPPSVPIGGAVRQIIGTDKPTVMQMRCTACQHEYELSSTDFMQQQAGQSLSLMQGTQDIDALLDRVEAQGGSGFTCPKCQAQAAQPVMKCPKCQKSFAPGSTGVLAGAREMCPHCGAEVPSLAAGLFGQQQDGGGQDVSP